jgi:hypothetical protein
MELTLSQKIKALWNAQTEIDIEITHLVQEVMPDYSPFYMHIGHWACVMSPIGLCVYDTIRDPAKDSCLFCEEPLERK